MKKLINSLIVVFLLFTFTGLKAQVSFQSGTFQQMLEKAKTENKILMVDFFTDWCKWCVELEMKVYSDPQVASYANTNFINYKIDAEKGEGIELAKKYKIPGYPTIVFLKSDGSEVDRIVGYFHSDKFLAIIKDYNSGKNTFDFLNAKLKEDPNDLISNFKYGEKLIDLEKKDEARPYFKRIIDNDPNNTSGYLDDAFLYIAYIDGDYETIKKFEEKFPQSDRIKDSYLFLAEIYYTKNKDYDNAENIYTKAFEKFGKDDRDVSEAYGQFLLDRIYSTSMTKTSNADDWKAGLALCEKCLPYVTGSINEASVYYIQASLYNNLGDKEKANDAINKAIKIHDKKAFRDLQTKINS